MHYVIRRTRYSHEITKFEDRSYPSDTYTISDTRCYCPARVRSCKHMRIFKTWKKQGSVPGFVYDENATKVAELFS